MEEQRKRKENFTDIEIRKLIELYSQHRHTLTAKQSNTITNKKKQTTWRQITEAINDCSDSGCLRTESDVRKKWKDLLSKAKKDLSAKKPPPDRRGSSPKIFRVQYHHCGYLWRGFPGFYWFGRCGKWRYRHGRNCCLSRDGCRSLKRECDLWRCVYILE